MPRTYSAEYKRLQPYVIEEIRKVVNALGVGGSSTGNGTVAKHAIAGDRHTGELAQTQAPWAATKVELSNHAALPDVHHAKLHAITDAANHSVTGSQYQIVGLTAVNTLGLLTPSASPAANAVVKTDGSSAVTLVDLTVTSDLFMSGYLDFGTDVIHEDASYLQVTGSKAVRFGQNIGNANWTLYNAGGYTTTGSISITGTAGDLTVGSNVLLVDNSANSVGIGGTPSPAPLYWPDPQFALDINGPCRATYFIGPHALQLKNVLLLAHYDGRAPYETNYSGEPNGHMGQVATVSGGVIYRPGKFYKAVQLAGAVTNCIGNPSLETNVTGWGVAGGALIQQITNLGYVGTCCARLYNATNGYTNIVVTSATAANTQYTLSAYVMGTGKFRLRMYDNVSGYRQSSEYTATSEWTRYTYTATYGTGSTDRQCGFLSTNGVEIYFDSVQLESGAVATPYCDGSLGDGHTWSGTAHASSSSRTEAKITYPATGNISAAAGTVMAWVRKCNLSHTMAIMAGDVNGSIDIYTSGTTINVNQRNVQALITYNYSWAADTWVHVAVTWAGTAVTLYVNGAQAATGTASAAFVMPSALVVGRRSDAQYNWGGWIDDLCILGYASPEDEIRSIYESNAPVFAETSTFSFRPTPKGLLWADDEGLWMKDTAANPVFGIYGGDATKSWGGFTMAPGDLLIGNNAVGSSAILWDQSAGTFGFYGAGSATAQVVIATDGRLTAGAGKVALDSSGFTAYNASSVETININADGIYMGDGGARTTIASWTSGNRIQWYSAGEIYEATPETYLDDSSVSRTLYPLVIRGVRIGNDAALIELAAVKSSDGAGAKIIIGEGFRLKGYFSGAGNSYATNRVVHAIADDVILEATNLQLYGMTTSTGAVGTYAGKIKVRIGGTDRYIPYYAS